VKRTLELRPNSRAAHSALLFLAMSSLVLLFACSKGSGSSTGSDVTIGFTQVLPSPFPIGGQGTLIASVTNDTNMLGVNWTVNCQSSSCGALTPTHTLSGAVTFYTAPNAVPAGNTVNITATSVANPSQKVTLTITLTVSTQQVSISFTQAPPGTVQVGKTAMITATVTNDPTNAGVSWQLTCAGGAFCGSFNDNSMTSSGEPITYTAPPTPPGNGGLVNIIAIANASPSVMVTSTTTIVTGSGGEEIMFNPAPPTSLEVNQMQALTADITGSSAVVDWTVTCGSADCGSFNPTTTASGTATTYTAPAMTPTNGSVTIQATASDNPNVNVTASIIINSPTSPNELLNGQYAFTLNGVDVNGFYTVSGSIFADGQGNITSNSGNSPGEEDAEDADTINPPPYPILGGTYTIGQDGRGQMLLYNDSSVGAYCGELNGLCQTQYQNDYVQIMSFAVVNASHSVITEFDYSAASHGRMDIQTSADFTLASVSGAYSFAFPGVSYINGPVLPAAFGGVFTATGNSGTFSATEDINNDGTVTLGSSLAGTYAVPDAFGRVTAMTNDGLYSFAFYIVDSTQLDFVEADASYTAGGPLFNQGSGAFSGAYGFTGAGATITHSSVQPRVEGGLFTASGGSLSGVIDVNDYNSSFMSGTLGGTYSSFSSGRGSLTLSSTVEGVSKFQAYVTNSQGVLLLETDSSSLSTGSALTQTSGTFSNGNYAAYFESYPSPLQYDAVGQIIAGPLAGTLTGGAMDVNLFDPSGENSMQTPDEAVSGTYVVSPNAGRYTGTLNLTPQTGTALDTDQIYYVLSDSTVLMLESDGKVPGTGLLQVQDLAIPQR
jgi:hypothetical protein